MKLASETRPKDSELCPFIEIRIYLFYPLNQTSLFYLDDQALTL